MLREYSAYDAKARFSELLRAVMDGERVVISYRGKPVAEMRPLEPVATTLADRLVELQRSGIVGPSPKNRAPLEPLIDSPGALARFLHERD